MGDMRIKYSVIIPTYNREPLLAEALRSVQAALPDCSEVIVVNDGTEFERRTCDLIETLGAVAVKTKGGLGAGAARNIGADCARGQWLLFLDDDDLIAVGYWQAVARYIDAHFQSTDLAYGFCRANPQSDRRAMQHARGKPDCVSYSAASGHVSKVQNCRIGPRVLGVKNLISKGWWH